MKDVNDLLFKKSSKNKYIKHPDSELPPRSVKSATSTLVLLLVVGLSCLIVSTIQTCAEFQNCRDSSLCDSVGDGRAFCAFSNKMSLLTSTLYVNNVSEQKLATILQGVCEPGDHFDSSSKSCVSHFPYPSALNYEIMDDKASIPHQRACGEWIKSGGLQSGNSVYRSFEDHGNWLQKLHNVEYAITSPSDYAVSSHVTNFRAACEKTVSAGSTAVGVAVVLAYKYLISSLTYSAGNEAISPADVVQFVGRLVAHGCDSAVSINVFLSSQGSFEAEVVDGVHFSNNVLSQSLFIVGESEETIGRVEATNRRINKLISSLTTPSLNSSVLKLLLESDGADRDELMFSFMYTNILNSIFYLAANPELDFDVRAYLKGTAAFCSVSLQTQTGLVSNLLSAEIARIQQLFHNRFPQSNRENLQMRRSGNVDEKGNVESEFSNDTSRAASSVTFSQLGLKSVGDANEDCFTMTRALFPDDIDATRFSSVVSRSLYDQLEQMVNIIRFSAAEVVMNDPVRKLLELPEQVAFDIVFSGFKISGAPRNTWAGLQRPIPRAGWNSADPFTIIALKQAKALFDDQMLTVTNKVDSCEHSPFFPSTEANAYAIPSLKCVVMFLGLLKKPWFDELYDEESMFSRALMIAAHEFGHMHANSAKTPIYDSFLQVYQQSTRAEALADVIAALAVNRSRRVETPSRILLHFCQLFCARTPPFSQIAVSTHPAPNLRCDHLVETITDLL